MGGGETGVPVARADTIARQIECERLAALHAQVPPTLLGGSVFTGIVAYLLVGRLPAGWLAAWLMARLGLALLRGIDGRQFARDPAREKHFERWRRRFFAGLWVDSIAWSVMSAFLPDGNDPYIGGLMIAAIIGVASAGVFSLSVHRGASAIFLGWMLVPLALRQATSDNSLGVPAAIGLLVYGSVLISACLRSHAAFTETLRLRFENAAIADERHRALVYAEHSSATKSRFLAAVSHELRTPLNGIIGMTQLLADDPLSATQQQRLGVLRHSAEHLLSVIGDLLDLSRIEFDRFELNPAPCLIRQAVTDVADLLRPLARERGLAFEVGFAADLPEAAQMDAARVRQVLHNLIGNALKFTAEGGIRIAVDCDGAMLHFNVSDTGEGVPEDAVERIFDAFEQGPGQAGARTGSGLGLTISRRLARAMGGDVDCQPLPGAGTRFRFSIAHVAPSAAPAPRGAQPAAAARPGTGAGAAARLTGRVLVVEDNDVNAMVVCAMLDQLGLATEVVTDGQQALARMGQGGQDLVMMDCQMPVMDGWEATRRWRDLERLHRPDRRLPIIALTASAITGERERCLAAGMDDYLSKPFSREDLRDLLQAHLARPLVD